MTDKPEDIIARVAPFAEKFAEAVAAEGRGFCIIRFKSAVAVVCFDSTNGADLLRAAYEAVVKLNAPSVVKSEDLKL